MINYRNLGNIDFCWLGLFPFGQCIMGYEGIDIYLDESIESI